MRRLLTSSLTLSLGLLAGKGWAEDIQWRPALPRAAQTAAAVCVGRAQPLAASTPGNTLPALSLGRPVALGGGDQVRTVSYQGGLASESQRPIVRAKVEDPLQPMPVGTPGKTDPPASDLSFTGPNSHPVIFGNMPEGGLPGGIDDCSPCGPTCGPSCRVPGPCCPSDCCLGSHPAQTNSLWVSAEYLNWGIKDSHLPPLVTTSPLGLPAPGALTQFSGTSVLLGGGRFDNEDFSGGRFGIGFWMDSCHTLGLEGSFLFLGSRTNNFVAGSSGVPILARPFFDGGGFENAQLIAFPGLISGTVVVSSQTSLWGAEANVRYHAADGCTLWGCTYRADLLGGVRYLDLQERLNITESLLVPAGAAVPRAVGPAGILVLDQFKTRNQFYGGQLGIDTELTRGKWFLGLTGKIGLGNMHEVVNINGGTTFSQPGVTPSTALGGLLAQPTNIGQYSHDRLAYVPEVGLKLGYNVSDHLRVYVGYDLLYANNVVRPGDQIDRVVNVSQIPNITTPPGGEPVVGAARPTFTFHQTEFWAQGVNFGLEFRY